MLCAANCLASPSCATSVLATTNSPDVSLSMRCTMPGRATPPIPDKVPSQWCSSAFTSVPSGFPAAGWTTNPAGLSTTSKCWSSNTTRSGMSWASLWAGAGSGTVSMKASPPRTFRAGSRTAPAACDSSAPLRIKALRRSLERVGTVSASARSKRQPAWLGASSTAMTWWPPTSVDMGATVGFSIATDQSPFGPR